MPHPYGAPGAGSSGHPATHKIGLTRACLRSGSLQLPFALWDALPEGEITMFDEHAGETVTVRSEPPRRVHGLAGLFRRHEVAVNDQLVVALGDDAWLRVRVEATAAPASRSRASDAGDAMEAPRDAVSAEAAEPERPAEAEPSVVERFGRVTVRRLGAGRSAPRVSPSEPAGPAPTGAPAPDTAAERRAELNQAGDLRTRVVRWLLRSELPGRVEVDGVAARFGLMPDVAADVLAGIAEAPPQELRLVREGEARYRVTPVGAPDGAPAR